MTQDAFIEQLRHELRSLPKHVVDEIVADYREYIGDALAAGRSEPEVVAALGDPAKLARELRAQANFRQWETRRSFGNLMRVFASIAGLGLLQLLLLVPFMFYLLLLTGAYALSAGLFAAGLAIVLMLGSHHLFGWPSTDFIPFSIEAGSDDGKTGARRRPPVATWMKTTSTMSTRRPPPRARHWLRPHPRHRRRPRPAPPRRAPKRCWRT